MGHQKFSQQLIRLSLILLFLVGCTPPVSATPVPTVPEPGVTPPEPTVTSEPTATSLSQPEFSFAFGSSSIGEGPGEFRNPQGISVNSSNNIIVTDNGNQRVQVFDPNGEYQSEFGSLGTEEGQFNNPIDSAIDSNDRIIVLDGFNHRVQVFDPSGEFQFQFGSQCQPPQFSTNHK